jgi:hypothetical protein
MFGFLFLKNLLPDIVSHNHNNHDEIGHIHFFQDHKKAHKKSVNTFENVIGRQQADDDDDENCSSGKSVFAYSHFPSQVYKIVIPSLAKAFDLIFTVSNNFKTPYLEPRRKPPRLA